MTSRSVNTRTCSWIERGISRAEDDGPPSGPSPFHRNSQGPDWTIGSPCRLGYRSSHRVQYRHHMATGRLMMYSYVH